MGHTRYASKRQPDAGCRQPGSVTEPIDPWMRRHRPVGAECVGDLKNTVFGVTYRQALVDLNLAAVAKIFKQKSFISGKYCHETIVPWMLNINFSLNEFFTYHKQELMSWVSPLPDRFVARVWRIMHLSPTHFEAAASAKEFRSCSGKDFDLPVWKDVKTVRRSGRNGHE